MKNATGSCSTFWITERSWLAHLVVVAITLWSLMHVDSSRAQTIVSRCANKSPSGTFECSSTPKKVDDWQYYISGSPKSVGPFMQEDAAKQAFEKMLADWCPTCCDSGHVVGQSGWVEMPSYWPNIPMQSQATLTVVSAGGTAQGCQAPQTWTTTMTRVRETSCTPWTMSNDSGPRTCYRVHRPEPERRTCNPISIPEMAKVFTEVDYVSPASGELRFVRDYRSTGFSAPDGANPWIGVGHSWTYNYAGALWQDTGTITVIVGPAIPQYFAAGSGGAGPLSPARAGQQTRLVRAADGSYRFYTADNRVIHFEGGLPSSFFDARGQGVQLQPSGASSTLVTDVFGRALEIRRDLKGYVRGVTDPAGQSISLVYKELPKDSLQRTSEEYAYTNLQQVSFQDGTSRQYVSSNWVPGGNGADQLAANLIVAVRDENNKTYKSIGYNVSTATVQYSQLAGGVGRYSVNNTTITDPLGTARNYSSGGTYNNIAGVYQPAGAGCPGSSSQYEFNATLNLLTSSTDHAGRKTCFGYDTGGRNVQIARVEGMASWASCDAPLNVNAVLPADSRKISTQWHPDWRLEAKVAEPGRITTNVYNGQPDPFNGNAVASCAPSGALLPDGKPIAVLCKQVMQATTDVNGAAGFGATLQVGVADRVTTWTYNQWGQVLTEDGPRTDVSDVTTYTYYPDTSFTGTGATAEGHTMGDLASVTDAAGQTTLYTKYNKHGQLLESSDANGAVTTHTYDLRLRLLSTTVGGQTTSYTYDPAGQLKKVTLPDASWVGYDYDDAHRQVAVYDHRGNRIEYTLDNAGNRIAENTKDPSGTLKRQLTRSIDALGRVQQTIGRE
jgi:YD repeat-containing protein